MKGLGCCSSFDVSIESSLSEVMEAGVCSSGRSHASCCLPLLIFPYGARVMSLDASSRPFQHSPAILIVLDLSQQFWVFPNDAPNTLWAKAPFAVGWRHDSSLSYSSDRTWSRPTLSMLPRDSSPQPHIDAEQTSRWTCNRRHRR